MAQAKFNVPEKSGGTIKEKDKDTEEKEGKFLISSIITFARDFITSNIIQDKL